MEWSLTEDGSIKHYGGLVSGKVMPTGHGYGPLYKWELWMSKWPAGHGYANTQREAEAAADAALARLMAAL